MLRYSDGDSVGERSSQTITQPKKTIRQTPWRLLVLLLLPNNFSLSHSSPTWGLAWWWKFFFWEALMMLFYDYFMVYIRHKYNWRSWWSGKLFFFWFMLSQPHLHQPLDGGASKKASCYELRRRWGKFLLNKHWAYSGESTKRVEMRSANMDPSNDYLKVRARPRNGKKW